MFKTSVFFIEKTIKKKIITTILTLKKILLLENKQTSDVFAYTSIYSNRT